MENALKYRNTILSNSVGKQTDQEIAEGLSKIFEQNLGYKPDAKIIIKAYKLVRWGVHNKFEVWPTSVQFAQSTTDYGDFVYGDNLVARGDILPDVFNAAKVGKMGRYFIYVTGDYVDLD